MIPYIQQSLQREYDEQGKDFDVSKEFSISVDERDLYETLTISRKEDSLRMYAIERYVKEFIIPGYFAVP